MRNGKQILADQIVAIELKTRVEMRAQARVLGINGHKSGPI